MKKIKIALVVSCLLLSASWSEEKIEFQQLLNQRDIAEMEKIIAKQPSNGEAYYFASLYYAVGDDEIGTNKDEIKQFQYLKKSADLGWKEAEMQYGFHLLNLGEDEEGIAYIQKSAAQGYVKALAMMGDLYFAGYQDREGNDVVKPDVDKSIEFLEKAIEQDSQDARYTLGHIYLDESTGKQNIVKALELFEANLDYDNKVGHLSTLISLIDLYNEGKDVQPNTDRLLDYYYLASLQDYAPSLYTIGVIQREGRKGEKLEVAKDLEAAFINLNKAAAHGYIDAMFRVGEMYFKGEGVAQSDTNAYIWTAIAEDLSGNQTNYSETILELIPKRQRQITIDNKNHLRQFFSMPSEEKEEQKDEQKDEK